MPKVLKVIEDRIVAVDERKKRSGEYLDLLGTYNPLTEPKEIILKQDKIDEWVKKGAVLSDGFLRMTKQAPQKPPRPPKKEAKEAPKAETPKETKEEAVEAPSEGSVEETTETPEKVEEAPVEEVKEETLSEEKTEEKEAE